MYKTHMTTISATYARANLASVIRTCVDDAEPVRIRSRKKEIVCMNADEWDAWQETMHIMSNPALASSVNEGIQQIAAGDTVEMTLDDIRLIRQAAEQQSKG